MVVGGVGTTNGVEIVALPVAVVVGCGCCGVDGGIGTIGTVVVGGVGTTNGVETVGAVGVGAVVVDAAVIGAVVIGAVVIGVVVAVVAVDA